MVRIRSFAEYVKDKCYNKLYQAAELYVSENWEDMNLYLKRVHLVGYVEMTDVTVQRVYVRDLPGMRVAFEVGLELEIEVHEGNYHYDETDTCYPWIRVYCEGDLSCGLEDWLIKKIKPFSKKRAPVNSLSDALVPFIPYDLLDTVATEFLKAYYPEALKVTSYGQPPVSVDPIVLAERLGLTIKHKRIKEDASVFGQIYFKDADVKMYDENCGEMVSEHIDAKTIIVDPKMYLFRNIGCVNNTIIHECVHWDKHKKVFVLEELYNADASHISCEVVGGAVASVARNAIELMEKQANQLTPRIQMPAEPFKVKAKEYIARFMREANVSYHSEVMEHVIIALGADFAVSRQAAKIRLVELGFDEAIGTFTYLDGHYVKPHGFRKGALKVNQTFSISAKDAAVERFMNPELRELTQDGDYLFVDNHYVYNAPRYVQYNKDGRLDLTNYARSHMDECCLIFEMKITSHVSKDYHTVCFLNRKDSNITFEVKFHNGYQNAPQERQIAIRKKEQEEWLNIRRQMTDDPEQCMELLLEWRSMKYTELADAIDINERTIRRTVKGETTPKVETAVRICFALHLPPTISEKLLEVLNCKLKPMDPNHQWIKEALTLKYPESYDAVCEWLSMYGVRL